MNINIRAQDFALSPSIYAFTRRRLLGAMRRFGQDVVSVDVYLKDINGPKGGADKLALIRARLRNRQQVTIETKHENLYAAIKDGARRTGRSVNRQLRRMRRIERRRLREMINRPAVPRATWI